MQSTSPCSTFITQACNGDTAELSCSDPCSLFVSSPHTHTLTKDLSLARFSVLAMLLMLVSTDHTVMPMTAVAMACCVDVLQATRLCCGPLCCGSVLRQAIPGQPAYQAKACLASHAECQGDTRLQGHHVGDTGHSSGTGLVALQDSTPCTSPLHSSAKHWTG